MAYSHEFLGFFASAPGSPVNGTFYYDTVLHQFQFYQNGGWVGISGSSGMTNPMDTLGDIIYGGTSGTPTKLAIGYEGATLQVASGVPSWVGGTPPATDRGLFAGSYSPTLASIDYIGITTEGNATNFGDLTVASAGSQGVSNATIGVYCGGFSSGSAYLDILDTITIATTGNATSFGGVLLAATRTQGTCSSSTRGVMGGGVIDTGTTQYITFASAGNAISFGTLTTTMSESCGVMSQTRGIIASNTNMDYITIATTGNATSFGTLTSSRSAASGACSRTRGVICDTSSTAYDYVTIATTGNATNFGTMVYTRYESAGTSNSLRGVFAGGTTSTTTIEFITIATTGNGASFGNLSTGRQYFGALSGSHGGL